MAGRVLAPDPSRDVVLEVQDGGTRTGALARMALLAKATATQSHPFSAVSLRAAALRGCAACHPRAVMNDAAVVAALDCLESGSIAAWVDGGWGIDALVGKQTRNHADLDLVVPQTALPAAQSALRTLGYRHDATVEPGLPARMVLLDCDQRQLDLHPVILDAHGNGWQPLGDGAWASYPAEGLTGCGTISGRRVRCLTPGLQLRHHLGYAPGANDRHDLRLLARHFGLALPPDY